VRFHGRNAAKWFRHEQAHERYDYRYEPQELAAWAPRIRELDVAAERTLVFLNNHYEAKAVTNARQLRELLAPGPPAAAGGGAGAQVGGCSGDPAAGDAARSAAAGSSKKLR
jgi:uncharacterized protein YecE (DUF72 family)